MRDEGPTVHQTPATNAQRHRRPVPLFLSALALCLLLSRPGAPKCLLTVTPLKPVCSCDKLLPFPPPLCRFITHHERHQPSAISHQPTANSPDSPRSTICSSARKCSQLTPLLRWHDVCIAPVGLQVLRVSASILVAHIAPYSLYLWWRAPRLLLTYMLNVCHYSIQAASLNA